VAEPAAFGASASYDALSTVASAAAGGGGGGGGGAVRRAPRDPAMAPVRKLTAQLIDTYKFINTVYYDRRKRRSARSSATTSKKERKATDSETQQGCARLR
jgi:hypothetical protein